MRRSEAQSFVSINAVVFEALNLLHVIGCEMFTFCDVLHETKQKTQTNSRGYAVRTVNHL